MRLMFVCPALPRRRPWRPALLAICKCTKLRADCNEKNAKKCSFTSLFPCFRLLSPALPPARRGRPFFVNFVAGAASTAQRSGPQWLAGGCVSRCETGRPGWQNGLSCSAKRAVWHCGTAPAWPARAFCQDVSRLLRVSHGSIQVAAAAACGRHIWPGSPKNVAHDYLIWSKLCNFAAFLR